MGTVKEGQGPVGCDSAGLKVKTRKIQDLRKAETFLDCTSASFSMACHVSIQAGLNHWLYQLTGDI